MAGGDSKTEASPQISRGARLRLFFGAWQPLTGGGVALFRSASPARLLAFQAVVAVLSALILAGALRRAWLPVITRALTALPEAAAVTNGRLRWPEPEPIRLAENAFLDLVIALTNRAELGQTADLQVAFQASNLVFSGVAGQWTVPYPPDWTVPLGRIEATARWGAWRLALAAGLGLAVTLGLLGSWWALATLYTLPAWLGAWLAGRQPGGTGTWQMAAAALLPGALFLDWGLVAYGLGAIRLPGLASFFTLHWLVGWLWLGWGVACCPRAGARPPKNPFADDD